MTYLAAQPDPGPLLRTLLRLRHDLVMIGRAGAVPLPERFQAQLGPPLARVARLRPLSARRPLGAYRAPHSPPLDEVEAALDVMPPRSPLRAGTTDAGFARRRCGAHLAPGFALEQLHQNFIDLARRVNEFAQSNTASTPARSTQDRTNHCNNGRATTTTRLGTDDAGTRMVAAAESQRTLACSSHASRLLERQGWNHARLMAQSGT